VHTSMLWTPDFEVLAKAEERPVGGCGLHDMSADRDEESWYQLWSSMDMSGNCKEMASCMQTQGHVSGRMDVWQGSQLLPRLGGVM